MSMNPEELLTPVQFAQLATALIDKLGVQLHHDEVTSVLRALRKLGYSILAPETRR